MHPIHPAVLIIAVIAAAVIAWFAAIIYRKKSYEIKVGKAEDRSKEIIDEAIRTAESKKREALLEAKEENMKAKNELSSTSAKEVFLKMFEEKHLGKSARVLAKELNLIQENDSSALEKIVETVLSNPSTKKAQEDYLSGQEKVLGFLVGQVMKESKGKANPSAVSEILKKKLK